MKLNKLTALAAGAFLLFAMTGCNKLLETNWKKAIGDMPKPKHVIQITQIVRYPRARKIEIEIPTFSGEKIWINRNSFVHSNVIKKIEKIPRENSKYYDLKLFLNKKGLLRWMQLSAGFKNEPLAFVIDGVFYRSFLAKPMVGEYDDDTGETYVIVEGPFDNTTADELVDSAPDNFLYYNDPNAEF